MLKRRNLFTNYLSVLFLCVKEGGIVMGNGADLGRKWSAAVEQILPVYQRCSSALRCDGQLSEAGSTSSSPCLPADTLDYFMLIQILGQII